MADILIKQNEILNKEKVLETIQKHKNIFTKYHVKTLALFGSTARNEATESSDLDFLVEFNIIPTFDNYMDLKFYLEKLFKKPIDLVIKEDLKPIIKDQVIQEAFYVS